MIWRAVKSASDAAIAVAPSGPIWLELRGGGGELRVRERGKKEEREGWRDGEKDEG